jgi:5-(hydroxymethyl)furfural/furfural oxidase
MIMMAVCRSSWHAIGQRIGTLSANLGYAYSRGTVRLSDDGNLQPEVTFNWLADPRDRTRIIDAFRRMSRLLLSNGVSQYATHPFPSSYSARVRILQRHTFRNETLTNVGAALMDVFSPARGILIDTFIREAPPLITLLSDDEALEQHICRSIGTTFHPCGTCRMGDAESRETVVDAGGKVVGADNLYVADASIMPEITRTNTNIPVIMIAEKISAHLSTPASV